MNLYKTSRAIICFLFAVFLLLFVTACSHYQENNSVNVTPAQTDEQINGQMEEPAYESTEEVSELLEIIPLTEYETAYYEDLMRQYVLSIPFQGVTSARVQIRFVATEERFGEYAVYVPNELVDINQLAAYHIFIEPDWEEQWDSGWRVVFTTNAAVSNFRLISIVHSFQLYEMCCESYCSCTFVNDVLFSLVELTPEMPLVAAYVHIGCFTSGRGISFLYDGVTRYFNIVHCNYISRGFG